MKVMVVERTTRLDNSDPSDLTALLLALSNVGIQYKERVDLSKRSAIRASGVVQLMIIPKTESQLITAIGLLRNLNIYFKIIGRLSNLLIASDPAMTPIISTENLKSKFINDKTAYAEAGCSLPSLCVKLTRLGWNGFWGLATVPGSVGGGVFMNAGAYGHDLSDFLISVRCITPLGEVVELQKDNLDFSWRYSAFKSVFSNHVILGATFKCDRGDVTVLEAKLKSAQAHRLKFLESDYPNLGSTLMVKDVYTELGRHFPVFNIIQILVKIALRVIPSSTRDSIWASIMSKLTMVYFRIENRGRVSLSPKTFNCVINRDNAPVDEVVKYIKNYHAAIQHRIPLEVEVFEDRSAGCSVENLVNRME